MTETRRWLLAILLTAGGLLSAALILAHVEGPWRSSWAPLWTQLGRPIKAVDHTVGRAIPVDGLDEAELGRAIARRYERSRDPEDPDQLLLERVLSVVSDRARRPFRYRGFVLAQDTPNAMALPGGVVLVTRGLLRVLGSEAELAAVLAHEVGHVERGHCFDAVKFELLARKSGSRSLGKLADRAVAALTRHSFSKAQEADADAYAWAWIVESRYDPRGLADSFASLLRAQGHGSRRRADPLRDYVLSHPPLELREAAYRARADAWWRAHSDEPRTYGSFDLARTP